MQRPASPFVISNAVRHVAEHWYPSSGWARPTMRAGSECNGPRRADIMCAGARSRCKSGVRKRIPLRVPVEHPPPERLVESGSGREDHATQNSLPSGSAITTWCPANSCSTAARSAWQSRGTVRCASSTNGASAPTRLARPEPSSVADRGNGRDRRVRQRRPRTERRWRPASDASAELFGQRDDDAGRTAHVAEPVRVLIMRHLSNEFSAVGS